MAPTINQLDAITRKYFVPKLYDNIFSSNVVLNRAKSKKWYKKIDGGGDIRVPVAYAKTSSAGWYAGNDTFASIADNDQMTDAVFDWKQAYASINITRSDELKNSGKAQVIDLVKTKMSLAEKTLSDKLGTGLFNAGTAAKELTGLNLAVDSAGVYAGIDRAAEPWWAANETGTIGAIALADINTAIGDCTVGNDTPTLIVTTQSIYDDVMALMQVNQRFSDPKTADAGFQNLLVQGIPMVVDSHCTTGEMFILNEDYLDLYVHSKEDFRFSGFVKPKDQNITVGQIFWMGELTCSNPRMQAKLTGIT